MTPTSLFQHQPGHCQDSEDNNPEVVSKITEYIPPEISRLIDLFETRDKYKYKKKDIFSGVFQTVPGLLLPPLAAELPIGDLISTTRTEQVFDELAIALPEGRVILASAGISAHLHDLEPILIPTALNIDLCDPTL